MSRSNLSNPPHTIISVPVQTAEGKPRGAGAPVAATGVQVPVAWLKRPPSSSAEPPPENPPHTRSSLPVHTPACAHRGLGGGAVPCQLHVVGESRATEVAVASFAAA